ncbi:MAG: PilZ domain-containing protein [Bradyrhizobium sp.]|uniref:PilZ domain-containing protein n=1 Tax=Bradyrhizobium sp. TaxID=376 RepID=UPI0012015E6B|nr:PilZ domain-containing protein [Bradyrhizobium sp.]THD63125.1 MAG: PilZ domain-containing protein [Bradyrhizobium sp.]
MSENRRAPRYDVLKVGAVKFGRQSVNCLVRNLSATGAAIEISSRTGLPERFVLVVPGDRLQLACRLVWRKEHRIGVAFS